jgi:hypothetical protein
MPLLERELRITPEQISQIDEWFHGQARRKKSPPFKVIAYQMGVSDRTIWDVVHRMRAYRNIKPPANARARKTIKVAKR